MEKILLVEDEARIRNIVLDYFTAHRLSCDLARNGEEALDILRDNDYDAILLDILMPGLDGFAVCQSVRKKSNVPIMFLTALGSEEDTLKGYALGCDDYVVKPFSLAILLAKTQALIRRRNGGNPAGFITCGAITLDTNRRLCLVGQEEVKIYRPNQTTVCHGTRGDLGSGFSQRQPSFELDQAEKRRSHIARRSRDFLQREDVTHDDKGGR